MKHQEMTVLMSDNTITGININGRLGKFESNEDAQHAASVILAQNNIVNLAATLVDSLESESPSLTAHKAADLRRAIEELDVTPEELKMRIAKITQKLVMRNADYIKRTDSILYNQLLSAQAELNSRSGEDAS